MAVFRYLFGCDALQILHAFACMLLHMVCCTIIFIVEPVFLIDVTTDACVFAYACVIVCKCFRSFTNQKHNIQMHNTTFMWHSILIHWFFSALTDCVLVFVLFYYLSSMCNWIAPAIENTHCMHNICILYYYSHTHHLIHF